MGRVGEYLHKVFQSHDQINTSNLTG